jgi:hypothetical protein
MQNEFVDRVIVGRQLFDNFRHRSQRVLHVVVFERDPFRQNNTVEDLQGWQDVANAIRHFGHLGFFARHRTAFDAQFGLEKGNRKLDLNKEPKDSNRVNYKLQTRYLLNLIFNFFAI